LFQAEDLVNGQVSLEGYPFKLIYLVTSFSSFYASDAVHIHDMARMDVLLAAAEMLEGRGWEIAGVAAGGKLICLRRRVG
jgi:hypothetical protein